MYRLGMLFNFFAWQKQKKTHKFHGVYTGLFAISKRLELEDRIEKAFEANLKKIPSWVRRD